MQDMKSHLKYFWLLSYSSASMQGRHIGQGHLLSKPVQQLSCLPTEKHPRGSFTKLIHHDFSQFLLFIEQAVTVMSYQIPNYSAITSVSRTAKLRQEKC